MDEVRGGWAWHCFVCRRAVPPALLAAADGQSVAGVCAACARREEVLWAVPGALGYFFPRAEFSLACRVPRVVVRPAA